MSQPYTPGQTLAWLDPHPDGLRLHRATVVHIEPATEQDDHWHVTTDRGDATVDHTGNSGRVLPLDADIAGELWERGDGYLIRPTSMDQLTVLERQVREFDLDLDTDLGDDLDLD